LVETVANKKRFRRSENNFVEMFLRRNEFRRNVSDPKEEFSLVEINQWKEFKRFRRSSGSKRILFVCREKDSEM